MVVSDGAPGRFMQNVPFVIKFNPETVHVELLFKDKVPLIEQFPEIPSHV